MRPKRPHAEHDAEDPMSGMRLEEDEDPLLLMGSGKKVKKAKKDKKDKKRKEKGKEKEKEKEKKQVAPLSHCQCNQSCARISKAPFVRLGA